MRGHRNGPASGLGAVLVLLVVAVLAWGPPSGRAGAERAATTAGRLVGAVVVGVSETIGPWLAEQLTRSIRDATESTNGTAEPAGDKPDHRPGPSASHGQNTPTHQQRR